MRFGLSALVAGAASFLANAAVAYQSIDRSLPEYRSAIYSFHEAYPDTLEQDTLNYATTGHFTQLFPDTLWAGWLERGLTNEDGSLAWHRSHDMMALLVLYEATHDVQYLERCWRFSVAAMAARDDLVGKQDFLGRSRPVWGTTRYGSGRRTTFLVHTALILEPLMTTLAVLDGKLPAIPSPPNDAPIWRDATPERRAELLARCVESLDIFEQQWRPGPGDDEGLYVAVREEESREDTPEPFNRQNLMAWDFYLAYALTGEAARLDRAQRLASFFKNRLELTPDDAYLWDYEPIRWEHKHAEEKLPISVCDDVSHGWIAIEPVAELVRAGVVFDPQDLSRFAHTLTRSVYQGDGVFLAKLGCSASFNKVLVDAVPGWLCVADGDPALLPIVRRFMLRHVAAPRSLFLAYLIALESRK